MTARRDVLVIGSGPAGAAAAFWLAEAGHDVVVIEKKRFPRVKTCGDGLTPRAVKQLDDMGLGPALDHHHRFVGLRAVAFGRTLELQWPSTTDLPSYGYVVTRHDLDQLVAERSTKAGAELWQDTEALAPITERGLVAGAVVRRKGREPEEIRARYVVVADGANSRFGRALGTTRDRALPLGMAIRGYYSSERHAEPWIESHLDIHDRDGNTLPGYGWVFPVGDGRVNVGVGLLSTSNQWKAVNTSHLMDAFAAQVADSWGTTPAASCGPPTGGRLPMSFSVGPRTGPTWVVAGDAAGAINPFNGEGIAYAYETGRIAAGSVSAALRGDGLAIAGYERTLSDTYGLYYKVAAAFVRIIGNPQAMRALVSTGMRSRTLMEWVLRIMANLLRPDELGPAEAAYKAVALIARAVPAR